MADWAGIKHAINSTLGTSNFSPIDQIIKNGNSSLASSLSTADNHVQSLRGGGYKGFRQMEHLLFRRI